MTETPAVGTEVRVTLRTDTGSERAVHQFEGKVRKKRNRAFSQYQIIDVTLPFGQMNTVSVPAHKAEFEVLSK